MISIIIFLYKKEYIIKYKHINMGIKVGREMGNCR
jgi:hypothetical protein